MNTLPIAVKAEPQRASVAALAPTTSSGLSQLPKLEPEPPRQLGATMNPTSLVPTPSGPLPPPSERRVPASDSPAEDDEAKAKMERRMGDEADVASRNEREDGLEPTEGKEATGASGSDSGSDDATAVDASTAASSPGSDVMDVDEDVKSFAPSPSAKPETRSARKRKRGDSSDSDTSDVKPDIKPEITPEVKAAIKAFKRDEEARPPRPFPPSERPPNAVTILDIETWAKLYFPDDPSDLPQPPSDLADVKHFHRDDLRGPGQDTWAPPMTPTRPMPDARLTPDPARNFCVRADATGRPFIWFNGKPKRLRPTSVFVDNEKNAKRVDQVGGWKHQREKYRYIGTYECAWAGKLVQADWDNATLEQKDAFIDCMVAYGSKVSNKGTMRNAWGFEMASIEGDLAARKRNIREELDDHAGRVGPTFSLYVYTGYSTEELDWVKANRAERRGD
ncbi:hypothetical protein RQP46_005241 [Phenoliferia psychrophenolica]